MSPPPLWLGAALLVVVSGAAAAQEGPVARPAPPPALLIAPEPQHPWPHERLPAVVTAAAVTEPPTSRSSPAPVVERARPVSRLLASLPPPAEGRPAAAAIAAAIDDIGVAPLLLAQISPAGPQLQYRGDELSGDGELLTLRGNAVITSSGDEVRADEVVVDQETMTAVATGNVRMRFGGQEFLAERVTYRYGERTGRAERVHMETLELIVDARTVDLVEPGHFLARGVRYTTCTRPQRDYEMHARTLDIYPQRRAVARNVGVDLFGARLATIPYFYKTLRPQDDDNETLMPHFGYNHRDGFFAEREYAVHRGQPVWVNLDMRLRTQREPAGGFLFATPGNLHVAAVVSHRDRASNQRARYLEVDRLPEIGLLYTPGRRVRPGRFLPERVGSIHLPNNPRYPDRWRFSAAATAGFFRQHQGDAKRPIAGDREGGRLNLQAQVTRSRLGEGLLDLRDVRVQARQSFYDGGRHYTAIGLGWAKHVQIDNVRIGVERIDNAIAGRSNFMFDGVTLRHEWRPGIEIKGDNFNFSYYARIDAERNGLFDQIFALSLNSHCLQPRITYRARQQEIGFEIRLIGLGQQSRPSPGLDRSDVDTEEDYLEPEKQPDPSAPAEPE